MDKDTKREELIESAYRCAKVLKEKYGVKKVFLIGSLVYGIVHDRSDIDLVVEGLAPEQYVKALVDLSDMLQWDVEINLIPFFERISLVVDNNFPSRKEEYVVKESRDPYLARKVLFGKRNEIAQKLMEFASITFINYEL